jgi:hypothetical protein
MTWKTRPGTVTRVVTDPDLTLSCQIILAARRTRWSPRRCSTRTVTQSRVDTRPPARAGLSSLTAEPEPEARRISRARAALSGPALAPGAVWWRMHHDDSDHASHCDHPGTDPDSRLGVSGSQALSAGHGPVTVTVTVMGCQWPPGNLPVATAGLSAPRRRAAAPAPSHESAAASLSRLGLGALASVTGSQSVRGCRLGTGPCRGRRGAGRRPLPGDSESHHVRVRHLCHCGPVPVASYPMTPDSDDQD